MSAILKLKNASFRANIASLNCLSERMGLARDGFPSHLTFFELFFLKVAFDDVAKNYKYTLTVKGHHVATRTFLRRPLLETFF